MGTTDLSCGFGINKTAFLVDVTSIVDSNQDKMNIPEQMWQHVTKVNYFAFNFINKFVGDNRDCEHRS